MSRDASASARDARCTVIIPARDAADTIAETIASVVAQTAGDWRMVVVDDASTDDTAAIVGHCAARDVRIQLISGPGRGTGAARNVAIHAATTPLIGFLDADDLLAPHFLERMARPLVSDAAVGAAYTGWLRLAPDGTTEEGPCPSIDGDLFQQFAAACVFPPHACVVRRELVIDVGGFDEAPSTTEDWDLWQKIARTGARFVRVPGVHALYRMRFGSRSRDSRRVLDDGLAVIARGHAADPRVRHPHPAHAAGADPHLHGRRAYNHLSWASGVALASHQDVAPLLGAITGLTAPDLDPWEVSGTLLEAMRVTQCAPPSAAHAVAAPLFDGLFEYLAALERASHARDLALRAARAIDHLIARESPPSLPRSLLTVHEASLDLAQPLPDVTGLPRRIDRFVGDVTYGEESIGRIELPVCDGRVGALFIADAVADAAGWRLLELFLERTVFPTLEVERTDTRLVVRRHGVVVGSTSLAERAGAPRLFEAAGWAVFVQELFGIEDRSLSDIYAPDTSEPDNPPLLGAPFLEYDASEQPRGFRTDAASVVVRCTVGGALLGDIVVRPEGGGLSPGALRRALAEVQAEELVRLAVREGIVGWRTDDGVALHGRLAQRCSGRREHRAVPAGIALLRHAGAPVGGPAARPVLLPYASRPAIERLAAATNTPLLLVAPAAGGGRATAGAVYLPDAPPHAAVPPLSSASMPFPAPPTSNRSKGADDDGVLVLCYTGNPAQRGEWRAFESQMAWLESAGYRGMSPDEWRTATETGEPPPGRRVLATFDGVEADFAGHAWPALTRYGIGALVFLATGAIVDLADGSPESAARTWSWTSIRALHKQGAAFGSYSVSQPRLTGQPVAGVVSELFESRAALEVGLGQRVLCFAYPHGEEDRAIRRLVGAAGYRLAVSRRPGLWRGAADGLSIPRVVVHANLSLDEFRRACAVA